MKQYRSVTQVYELTRWELYPDAKIYNLIQQGKLKATDKLGPLMIELDSLEKLLGEEEEVKEEEVKEEVKPTTTRKAPRRTACGRRSRPMVTLAPSSPQRPAMKVAYAMYSVSSS